MFVVDDVEWTDNGESLEEKGKNHWKRPNRALRMAIMMNNIVDNELILFSIPTMVTTINITDTMMAMIKRTIGTLLRLFG